jgi:ribosomal protein S18 acetylase RimI-like enzyme
MLNGDLRIEFGSDYLLPAFCAGFNAGFGDYKYGAQMDEPQFVKFLVRSGIDLQYSAVLLQRNSSEWQGAGVALVALEEEHAWCSGLAVTPSLRNAGLGRRLMETIQARVAQAGAQTLQLEVLVDNAPARQLYTSLGYTPLRNLIFWRTASAPPDIHCDAKLYAANPAEALDRVFAWQRLAPAWQRSQRAVALYLDDLWAYRMQHGGETTGWIVYLPTEPQRPGQPRLRIMAMGVHPGEDEASLAHQLLASMRAHQSEAVFSLINEPEESIFTQALATAGFIEVDRQIEMVRRLGAERSAMSRRRR